MTDSTELTARSLAIVDEARAFDVSTAAGAQAAAGYLTGIVSPLLAQIDEFCDPNIQRWHAGWKQALAEKAAVRKPVEEAKQALNAKVLEFRRAESARIAAEQARLRAEAVKTEEEKRLAAAVELERRGQTARAEALLARPVTVAAPVVEAAKLDGVSTRKRWPGAVTDLPAFLAAVAANPAYHALVEVRQGELDRLGTSTRGALQIPGVEWQIEEMVASRRK